MRPGVVLESSGRHDRFAARVRADDEAFVLFRMTYHPAWRARVGGAPVTTVMLAPGFVGIPIQAGEHRLEIKYVPDASGTVLFYLGAVVLALVFLADRVGVWTHDGRSNRPLARRVALESVVVLVVCGILWLWINARGVSTPFPR